VDTSFPSTDRTYLPTDLSEVQKLEKEDSFLDYLGNGIVVESIRPETIWSVGPRENRF
jgi:hypothetical protein